MKKINVEIRGKTPLLMHQYPLVPIPAIEKKEPVEQAEIAAYRDQKTKQLFIPAMAMQRALISGATYSKGKGRASLQKQVAACVQIQPEQLGLGTAEFQLDARSVVVPATKGRIVRYRPRLDEWKVTFDLLYDEQLLTEQQARQVLDDTGQRVGILDFRPEKKGPFGTFMVTKWEKSTEER